MNNTNEMKKKINYSLILLDKTVIPIVLYTLTCSSAMIVNAQVGFRCPIQYKEKYDCKENQSKSV